MEQATLPAKLTTYLVPLLLVVVVLGFWRSYFLHLEFFGIRAHLHGLVMFALMGLLIAQAVLVRTGRMDWHRCIGRASFVVAPLVILSMVVMMRGAFADEPRPLSPEVFQNLTLSFFAFAQFTLLYALAILFRRQTPLHARYMISTGVVVTGAGSLRIFLFWITGLSNLDAAVTGSYVFLELVTLALILNDLRIGRIRAPFVLTLALIMGAHVMYWTAADMAWWRALGRWILG